MTRLEHCLELVGDIRDCALRAKDLGFLDQSNELTLCAAEVEHAAKASERPSLPPVLAANQETRAKADEHFKNARKILKGLI